MATWRELRASLAGRALEISQEQVASDPDRVASVLTRFLGMEHGEQKIADLFRSKRVLSSFPERPPGDYSYRVDWPAEKKRRFIELCGEEMEAWGFEIDFESPAGAQVRE